MIKDIVESLQSNIKERAASPLLGSYTVSAVLYNWKPIVVLLTSDRNGTELTAEVSAIIPNGAKALLLPLLVAVLFSVLYPSAKAIIGKINALARLWELKTESDLEAQKESMALIRERSKTRDTRKLLADIDELASNSALNDKEKEMLLEATKSIRIRDSRRY